MPNQLNKLTQKWRGNQRLKGKKVSSGVESSHRISAEKKGKKKNIQPPAPKKEGVGTTELMEISPSEN